MKIYKREIMKKHVLISALVAQCLIALPVSAQIFDDQLCSNANSFIQRDDVLSISGEANNVFESGDPTYVEAGKPTTLNAAQNKQVRVTTSFPYVEYVTTRDFLYFTADPNLSVKEGFTPNENSSYQFSNRGASRALVVALDDEVKQIGPFGDEAFVPLCEAITIYAHNPPTFSVVSETAGASIFIELDVNLDSLSRFARERNGTPRVSWSFFNELNSITENITTDGSSVNFAPRYNGAYQVRVKVSDGTLATFRTIITGQYTGGIPVQGGTQIQ